MSLPFHTVITGAGKTTHLAVITPAMPGHAPGQLPPAALCGLTITTSTPIADVECLSCLYRTPEFMALPGFGVAA